MPSTIGYAKDFSDLSTDKAAEAVRIARQGLQWAKQYRDEKREQVWRQSEDQYEGKHWQHTNFEDPTADLITINVSFSTINTIVPYVTGQEPNFLVEPYSGDANPRNARIQAALLNRVWRSADVMGLEKLEDVAVDMLIYGDGYMQVGHAVEDMRLESGEHVDNTKIILERLDPWDVWIDPSSDGLHNARWVARRVLTTLTELEDDDRYRVPQDMTLGLASEFFVEDEALQERMFQQGDMENDIQWVALYEYYDLVRDRMFTFSQGTDLPLRWIDGPALPIVQFSNYRIPRCPYHMGELEQLWEMQKELNKTRSQMITHRRRNVQKIAYLEDAMSEEGISALTSPIVNEGIPLKGDLPLDQLIQPLEVPTVSSDAYNISDIITRDVYEISGVNEYLRGATPEVRRTATEATIIEGASNVKSQYKLRLIEKGTRRVGQLMLDVMADAFPQTQYDELGLYLTGSDAEAIARMEHGQQIGQMVQQGAGEQDIANYQEQTGLFSDVVVSPNDALFKGKYEVFVEQRSTELRNPVMREQRAREMFLAIAQIAPLLKQFGVPVNLRKLLERWLEAANVKDIDGILEMSGQQASPLQEMIGRAQAQGQGGPAGPGGPSPQMPAGPGADPTRILDQMGALTSDNTGQQVPA